MLKALNVVCTYGSTTQTYNVVCPEDISNEFPFWVLGTCSRTEHFQYWHPELLECLASRPYIKFRSVHFGYLWSFYWFHKKGTYGRIQWPARRESRIFTFWKLTTVTDSFFQPSACAVSVLLMWTTEWDQWHSLSFMTAERITFCKSVQDSVTKKSLECCLKMLKTKKCYPNLRNPRLLFIYFRDPDL